MAAISAHKFAPAQGAEQKRLKFSAEVTRARAETVFLAYSQPLGNTISFYYLDRLLSSMDNDWLEFVAKLKKERKNRAHMLQFFGQSGAYSNMFGTFFKLVIQYVLLFVADTRSVTPRLRQELGGFNEWVSLCITGKLPRRQPDGIWLYPLIIEAMEAA